MTMADSNEEARVPHRLDENSADISADLAALREDVARLSDTLASVVRSQADAAGATIRGAVDDARGQLSQAVYSIRDSALEQSADFERRIERNPLTAVLIAAGVGMAFGVMSRPR
jgi:ElaB/YqjD/DUF883 family membrane-anchored ribosome-binding protein